MSYDHRITLAVPASMIDDANALASCVGISPADVNTFQEPGWKDSKGNLYSVCSSQITVKVIGLLGGGLVVPEWPVDLLAAQRAKDAIVIGGTASPSSIAVAIDVDGLQALYAMGLTPAESGI